MALKTGITMSARTKTTTAIRQATRVDLALLVAIAIIWASAFIAIKIAVPDTGPLWLAALRVGIGALVLLPYALWRGLSFPRGASQWRLIIIMAMLNVTIPFYLISWAEQTIDAGVTALLMGTGPFLALVGSHIFTSDDKITGPKLTAVLLGFSGMVILVGWDALSRLGASHTLAQMAALGGSMCYVVAGLIIRRIELDAASLAVLALLIGSTILIPTALLFDGPPSIPGPAATGALIFLGIVPTGIAYILRFYLIRTVGYATFSLSVNMIPVFGVFLGALILGETLRPQVLIALALVVGGLFITRRKPHKAEPLP